MAAPEALPGTDTSSNQRKPPRRRRWRRLWFVPVTLWLGLALWHTHKPLPPGVHVQGEYVATPASAVQFLADVTGEDGAGQMIRQRAIHQATLELVRDARDFLVMDFFLFNHQGGPAGPLEYREGLSPTSAELIEAVRDLRHAQPELPVLLVTDPINDYYRGSAPPELAALRGLGIDVVVTRLDGLRDSNFLYSAAWRMLFAWWLPSAGEGRLPNVLDGDGPPLKLGALLRLPNFKANHRKVAITGDGNGSLVGIVASSNPHDASSAHSNVALRVAGEALRPLLASELDIARSSGWQGGPLEHFAASPPSAQATGADMVKVATVTEGAIRESLLQRIDGARAGDAIDIAQFYLSDRSVARGLLDAAGRGARVRVLLDPNRDAFGFEKSGIPNRPLGNWLVRRSDGAIALRWYRTHGEQFHAKFAGVTSGDRAWFTVGSANLTRRNIGDFNLEANVMLDAPLDSDITRQAWDWFEALWNNAGGMRYTDDASAWQEDSALRYWKFRVMEATGLSTF
jgi:hypothetical protein